MSAQSKLSLYTQLLDHSIAIHTQISRGAMPHSPEGITTSYVIFVIANFASTV